jgi:hypothetical protein
LHNGHFEFVIKFEVVTNCVNDNLDCFKDGFDNIGSFLDVGGHRFYITKPFPEEVADVLDPLCDAGSSCCGSINLVVMVEVLALRDEEGGDSPRARRSNAFFRRSRTLHSQSWTPRASPSWTCAHHSVMPSTPSSLQRHWSGRASPSSARWSMMKTPGAA